MRHDFLQVVNICRLNALLGLRVMGGVDRPQHVFRQGDKSGVFILHILEGSPASKVGKLRAGDRILQVGMSVSLYICVHSQCVCPCKAWHQHVSYHVG